MHENISGSSQNGCKFFRMVESLKQPPILKHKNFNTFVHLLRQWQTEVTQTSQEVSKCVEFQNFEFCIVKRLF